MMPTPHDGPESWMDELAETMAEAAEQSEDDSVFLAASSAQNPTSKDLDLLREYVEDAKAEFPEIDPGILLLHVPGYVRGILGLPPADYRLVGEICAKSDGLDAGAAHAYALEFDASATLRNLN